MGNATAIRTSQAMIAPSRPASMAAPEKADASPENASATRTSKAKIAPTSSAIATAAGNASTIGSAYAMKDSTENTARKPSAEITAI